MPSFEIMDMNGNTKEFDINKIKSTKDVARAFKEFHKEVKSKKEILEHYNSNKDFQNLNPLVSGAYVSKENAKKYKVAFLNVRYNNLMKIAVIDISKDNFQ